MKNKFLLLITLLLPAIFSISCKRAQQSYSNDKPAYIIYNSNGNKVTYSEMLRSVSNVDICFFGELHNDPISHWLELQLVKDLYSLKKGSLVVGAEMWESDNQIVLDEML